MEYYGALADGLPHQLTRAIQPNGNPPIPFQHSPFPSSTTANFKNHNNHAPQLPQPPSKPPPTVRRTRSVDTPDRDDDQDDYLMLQEQSLQPAAARRQPPPPPRGSPSKFNRPPPLLPSEAQDTEGKPQTIIKSNELEKCAELGQGEFGSVLRGIWRNPTGVAVSILKHAYISM